LIEDLPVSYAKVLDTVPSRWSKQNPAGFVHVGVSTYVDKLTLETTALNDGYTKLDIDGKCAEDNKYVNQTSELISV
jgi:pyrrolidone-carboxylate peptidase